MNHLNNILWAAALALLGACSGETSSAATDSATDSPKAESASVADTLRLQLETAKSGDTIVIPAGNHSFKRSLTLNTDGVTIRGAGMDKTILSFAGQVAGAEGLLVNASDFTIEDLAIEDATGDALKVNDGNNIVIRRVRTEWTNGPATDNGAYGFYPVQTTNVLIEGVVAIGASDAGIYVGQSRQVVVRDSRAEYNVAGIEIENTINADVYNNVATNNTGGILVFNMPDLPMAGHSTRVFNNTINSNNLANFGRPGTAVAGVPAGSGLLINSNDNVEVFGNTIGNNNTGNVLISSFYSSSLKSRNIAEAFDAYPEGIYIYDNTFSGGGDKPDKPELAAARSALGAALPDVVWDGYVNPDKPSANVVCVRNGDTKVLNLDAPNEYANPTVANEPYRCDHTKLAAVELAAR